MALNRMRCSLAAAFALATFAAPARAQDPVPLTFQGPRVEALVGTDSRVFYGGAAGYDFQHGKIVFGIETELDLSGGRRCETLDFTINDRLCIRGRRDLYFGGRVGVAVGPGTLLYAKLGYTNLRQRVDYDAPVSAGGGFTFVDRGDGVRVGAGLEQRIGTNLYLKGEYRYSNYDRGGWKHDGVVGIGIRF